MSAFSSLYPAELYIWTNLGKVHVLLITTFLYSLHSF